MGGKAFVVLVESTAFDDPGEGPLDDPTAGQHVEGGDAQWFAHDLDADVQDSPGPAEQLRAAVAAVGSDQRHRGHGEPQPVQHAPCPVPVLHRGAGDDHGQQQPHGVDHDMTLPAVDFLALMPA